MDEEGYPLPGTRLIPVPEDPMQYINHSNNNDIRYPNSTDEESGEATARKVIVLRSAPRAGEHPWSELSFLQFNFGFPHVQRLQRSLNKKTLYLDRYSLSTTDFTAYQSNSRVPPYHIVSPELSPSEEGGETRAPFRVPLSFPTTKASRNNNEVTISIWREFCRGPLVYEDTMLEWQQLKKKCILWPHLQAIFGDFAQFVPYCVVWMLRVLLCGLKICIPWVGLQLVYFHFLYIHMKIHVTGEKRGLEPVFVGQASQGPMIYSIRHLTCPYCRQKRQKFDSLWYLEKLRQEQRDWAVG